MPRFFSRKKTAAHRRVGLVLLTLLAGLLDVTFGRQLVRQYLSSDYPVVTGKIVGGLIGSRISSSRHGGIIYYPIFHYRYVVDGRTYDASRYRYVATTAGSRDNAGLQQIMMDHPAGSETPVSYNPENPQDALLVTGLNGYDKLRVLFYGLLNCAVVVGWFRAIRTWKKSRHQARHPKGPALVISK